MRKTSRVLLRVPAPIVASLHEVRSKRAQRVLNLSRARADGAGKALSHRSTGRRGSREEVAREHFCPQENQVSRGAQGRPAATAPTRSSAFGKFTLRKLASVEWACKHCNPGGADGNWIEYAVDELGAAGATRLCVVGCQRRISAATPVFLGRDGSHCDPPPIKWRSASHNRGSTRLDFAYLQRSTRCQHGTRHTGTSAPPQPPMLLPL